MDNDEFADKQKETLNNLKKYNDSRKTEVVDDTEGNPTTVTQYVEESNPTKKSPTKRVPRGEISFKFEPDEEPEPAAPQPEAKPIMSHICPYCGNMAYMGQLHGLGYCKEKVQYEQ